MLSADDLPGGFTAYAQGRSTPEAGSEPEEVDDDSGLCGMRNPADTGKPIDRAQFGYSRRTGGPFVYETVAIYPSADAAEEVFDTAKTEMASCLADGAAQQPPISGSAIDVGRLGDASAGFAVEVSSTEVGVIETAGDSSMDATSMDPNAGSGRQMYVSCQPSHRAIADPIVHPVAAGETPTTAPGSTVAEDHDHHGPGMVEGVAGHSHDFFGNDTTDGASTLTSLLAGTTTCGDDADRSAYWVPTLYRDGEVVAPVAMRAWYGVARGMAAADLTPLPNGLKAIAGDADATSEQDPAVVGWRCGADLGPREATPPSCGEDDTLSLQLTFPPCWDGVNLDSADHRSHLAAAVGGRCPASHPVAVPQLSLVVDYGLSGPQPDLQIASGDLAGIHGDVFVAWADDRQRTLIDRCLVATADCAAGIGPGGLPAYAHAVIARKGPTIVVLAIASFDSIDEKLTVELARKALAKQPDR